MWEDTRPDERSVKTTGRPSVSSLRSGEQLRALDKENVKNMFHFSERGITFIYPVSNTPSIGRVCGSVPLFFLLVLAHDTVFPCVLCDFVYLLLSLLLL